MTPAEAIEAAELVEAGEATAASSAGRCTGRATQPAEADMAERWARAAAAVSRGRSFAELEERRWGPGGREHFADARPGDFPRPRSAARGRGFRTSA